jgi:hypothetical protein
MQHILSFFLGIRVLLEKNRSMTSVNKVIDAANNESTAVINSIFLQVSDMHERISFEQLI